MSITGNGSASKEQVAAMLQRILHIPDENMPPLLDATDGLAAALCHFYQTNRPHLDKSYNSWKDFINKNPDKVSSGKKSDKKYQGAIILSNDKRPPSPRLDFLSNNSTSGTTACPSCLLYL